MVATGRRVRSYRKSMTVLGKIPVAPKPLNLPSQRLENLLGPDVDFVLRGGRLWRSTFLAPGDEDPKPETEVSLPTSGGREEENAAKEGKPVVSKGGNGVGGEDTLKNTSLRSTKKLPPSEGLNRSQTMHRHAKMEGLRSHASSNPARATKQETWMLPDPLPSRRGGEGKTRGSIPSIRYGSFSTLGVPPPGFEDVGLGPVTHSNPSKDEGFYNVPPHLSSKKEREIIVIHMVGHPGFYGSYPVQIGYSETVNRLASPPLQFGNFVPNLGLAPHDMHDRGAQPYAGAHFSTATSPNLFGDHDGFICYEKECYRAAHDHGRRRNGRVHGNLRETAFLNNAQQGAHEALLSTSVSALAPRSSYQKHMFKNPGRLRSTHADTRVDPRDTLSAKPVHFTLLKKVPQKKPSVEILKEEIGTCEVAGLADVFVGSDSSACVNKQACEKEGDCTRLKTQTEPSGARNVTEATDIEKSEGDGAILVSQTEASEPVKSFDSLQTPGPQASLPQGIGMGIDKESVSEQSMEDDTITCVDGCKLEVKHVIFDADSCSTSGLVKDGGASLNGMGKGDVSSVDKELSNVFIQNGNDSWDMIVENKQEKPLFQQRDNAKNKHKHPVASATIDPKVLATQWKPKKIQASIKPGTKASKRIRKAMIRVSKSVVVHDVQQRQSCSIVNAFADSEHSSQVEMPSCEVEGDCLSLDTTTKTNEAGKVIKGERNESGCVSGRPEETESTTPAEKAFNGFKVEVKHVICSVLCDKDTLLNGVAMAEASSIHEETSEMGHQLHTSSHKTRSNSGSNNKGNDNNLVLAAKMGQKVVSPAWKPKAVAVSQPKLVTKVSKGSQASAIQSRKSVVTQKFQNLHVCSLVGPTVSVDWKPSSQEKGPVNARLHTHSLENLVGKTIPKNVSESKKKGWTSQKEIGQKEVVEYTGNICASLSSAYGNKNLCEGGGGECMRLVTTKEALKADENSCIGLAGKVAEGHSNKIIEAETTAFRASTNHVNRKARATASKRESFLGPVEGGLSPHREQGTIGDGCKLEVKHAIFDASCATNGLMCDGDSFSVGIAMVDSAVTAKPASTVERICNDGIQADHPGPSSAQSHIIHHRTAREELIHQMVHRKFKETGKWKPKAGYQAPVSDNAGNNDVHHSENKGEVSCNSESQAIKCDHESKTSHSRPFFKTVRHRTDREEHLHELVHRKYKETGQWKPKAVHQQVVSTRRRAARQ